MYSRTSPSEVPTNAALGFRRMYEATGIGESPWSRLAPTTRRRLIYAMWLVTWPFLFAGLFESRFYEVALAITVAHAIAFLALVRFRVMAFPAQLRIAYLGWLAVGTYVPQLEVMMYITTAGLGANLLWGYCPLSRMMYLLPWNRAQRLTLRVFVLTFFSAPRPGRFAVAPAEPTIDSIQDAPAGG